MVNYLFSNELNLNMTLDVFTPNRMTWTF